MKHMLRKKISDALTALAQKEGLEGFDISRNFVVEEPRDAKHGHLATNAAMTTSKVFRKKPADLADLIMAGIDNSEGWIERMEKAGPGFINFTLSLKWWAEALGGLLAAGDSFGRGETKNRKVMVEFVSANPTGPLHVGHGRGAAIGDALARVMEYAGFEVVREYYINDAGRQMRILGASVYARLLELSGSAEPFPEDHYRGEYIKDLAKEVWDEKGPAILSRPREEVEAELTDFAEKRILNGIKEDLAAFRVQHEVWFRETTLYKDGLVPKALADLKARDQLYEKDGALWFRSEALGDDKDRVLIKSSGDQTYFAADIAYHWNKYDRGFDQIIDVLGADHHGYVQRLKSAVKAFGRDPETLNVLLVQLVSLIKEGKVVAMSTRAGEFVTLREVVDEVGADAARFIFLTRSPDSPLDFDIDLAKSQTKDNPVYYVQYVGARINSILKSAAEAGLPVDGPADLSLLVEPEEVALIKHLTTFPDLIQSAAAHQEPHHLTSYLSSLARLFHHYYSRHRIAADDPKLAAARLTLARAIRGMVRRGLNLLGVESPDSM
ncbi:arginine--tRNA ligase [Deltaproteobacteria bacterium Smac51]|nr:arginine--tRNA ligase [Deltaproteobacteria bacterium Smac51]